MSGARGVCPLVVVPARLAATRLPRKPLALIGGEPMVWRVMARKGLSCLFRPESKERKLASAWS